MPGLLAANIEAVFAHMLNDITVPYRGSCQAQADILEIALKSEVGHHGCDNTTGCQTATAVPTLTDHCHQLIAINNLAVLIDDDNAVGIAVQCNPDICPDFLYFFNEGVGRSRAAIEIDVTTVRLNTDFDHIRAQLPQCGRRDTVSGPICAIDHNAQALQAQIARQRAFGEFNVAFLRAFHPLGTADFVCRCQKRGYAVINHAFNFKLRFIRKLITFRVKKFNTIILEGIVGS